MTRPIGHVDLAMGKDVDYAGRLYFSGRTKRGILRKWTNESGHYRPTPEFMSNAGLPEDLIDVLTARFEEVPPELMDKIDNLYDMPFLKQLHRQAITISSLEEFQQLLSQN